MSDKFNELQEKMPFPNVDLNLKAMPESFIGKGKDIIVREIYRHGYTDLLEVGSFLGGSIFFWLNACYPLNIVAVDPFTGGWAGTHCVNLRYNKKSLLTMLPEDINVLNSINGLYHTFLRNFEWAGEYKKRVVILRQTIEEAIPILQKAEYKPDIIFLDANKNYNTLELLFQSFKNSQLSGDDYQWKDSNEQYAMQYNLRLLCETYGLKLQHHEDTWLIHQ